MNLTKHPLHFLDFLRKRPDADTFKLRFVTYTYTERVRPSKKKPSPKDEESVFDELHAEPVRELSYGVQTGDNDREYFDVPLKTVNERWLRDILAALPEDHTFGFTGLVLIGRTASLGNQPAYDEYFVPVLDLKGKALPDVNGMLNHFGGFGYEGVEASAYQTDASYHVYFSALLPKLMFRDFLGRALLFNAAGDEEIEEVVDTRWVGHSLVRDAATARWSKKNENKRDSKLPALVGDQPSFIEETKEQVKKSFREAVMGG